MATLNLRRFSEPKVLSEIRANRLLKFLAPYRQFFVDEGVVLPAEVGEGQLDYWALRDVLIGLDETSPQSLRDSLYLVHDLATPEGQDALCEEAERWNLPLTSSPRDSPADTAIQAFLMDPNLLERVHLEKVALRRRSFRSFRPKGLKVPELSPPDEGLLQRIAADLDSWFVEHRRGEGSRLIAHKLKDETCFLIRHGEPLCRVGIVRGDEPASIFYRPERYDVVAFHHESGRLRINAKTRGEQELYRTTFGLRLFNDKDKFPGGATYTLDPLRVKGRSSLVCNDVDGIEEVLLTEIRLYFGGGYKYAETLQSEDLFEYLAARDRSFPQKGALKRAKFRVKFADSKKVRTVEVRPPNILQCARNDDPYAVEDWLEKRGFLLRNPYAKD